MNVAFGQNDNIIEGWTNLRNESDGDITKRLNFEDASVSHILIEHCLEHVSQQDAYRFLAEAHRILVPSGVIRVLVPDIRKIWELADADYLSFIGTEGQKWNCGVPAEPTPKDAVEALIFCHGHKSVWSHDLLLTFMSVVGFKCSIERYGESKHPALHGIDRHWQMMGWDRCVKESVVMEGIRI